MNKSSLNRRNFIKSGISALAAGLAGGAMINSSCAPGKTFNNRAEKPNFVIIYCDDLGYGDWDRGGHPTIRTPNLGKMADEGITFTQFYAGAATCSPSRAALMTGRNYIRTGIITVLFPEHPVGLAADEVTIAEALKTEGYSTACIGKWHLGHTPGFMPRDHGFDYYYGLLYSNDMKPADLYRNEENIEAPADQATLTKRYTEETIAFIEREKDKPFFVYLPHTMPHWPRSASENFLGKSVNGIYGDAVEELDWSVGQINDTLDRLGLSENTLVIFTSDNGCDWTGGAAGSKGMLRGAKGDTFEGGMRVPFVARWKSTIPEGRVSGAVASVVDFLPTFVTLAGGSVPEGRNLDGQDITGLLKGGAPMERTIEYYRYDQLTAIRRGPWKLHYSYYDRSLGLWYDENTWITPEVPLLFNVERDPAEVVDRAADNPEILKELTELAENYRREIAENDENSELIKFFLDIRDGSRVF